MTAASTPFVLVDGLSSDLSVLEASAGTGKTFTLAALSTFAIGRGDARIGELCVATFTEAATAELRGRLRQRIAQAVAFLDGGCVDPDDELELHMASLDAASRAEWLERLRAALRDFDTASITTIHGFCSRVVGAVAGLGSGVTLTADVADVDEVVRDVLLGRLAETGAPDIAHDRLLAAVTLALSLPAAAPDLIAAGEGGYDAADPDAVTRARRIAEVAAVVDDCVAEIHRRRSLRLVRTFDDLLADTRSLLLGPGGEAIAVELRRRFRVVLVDEFQDTDQVQWDILRSAFLEPRPGAERTRMVIVGDPKQSIYRFRAAELSAYLAAREFAVAHGEPVSSLLTNYRTDQPLLDALNALFRDFTFGDDAIEYRPVTAPDPAAGSGLRGMSEAVLQFRSPDPSITAAGPLRDAIQDDLGDVVVELLRSAEIVEDDGWRPVRPSDIGILVTSNDDALRYAALLRSRDVPAVASSSDSVLGSAAAAEWRILLTALDRPSSDGAVRHAALSWFDDLDAAGLAALDDPAAADDLAALFDRYRQWSRLLTDTGLPALLSVLRAHGVSRRVLSRRGGERDLTDLEHVAELLQSRTAGRPTTAGALIEILDELESAGRDEVTSSDLYDRRIDRDDDTVRIMTVHKAKGLEFEIVLVPGMWNARSKGKRRLAHAGIDGRRVLDIDWVLDAPDLPPFDRVHHAAAAEDVGEDRRKLYVALTRAKHRLIVWVPLAYTWSGGVPVAMRDLLMRRLRTSDAEVRFAGFDPAGLVEAGGGTIEFVAAPATSTRARWTPAERPARTLSTAIAPAIDRTWRRWSYTGFTRALGDDHIAPIAIEVGAGFDEPSSDESESVPSTTASDLPLRSVPGGKVFGTLVHSVLEVVDFVGSDDEVRTRLRDEIARVLRYRSLRGVDADRLADGLLSALRAPLGGPLGAVSLSEVARDDRLDELGFDLPLARVDLAELAAVVLPHLDANEPLRPWFATAVDRHLPVEGVLNGSIDLVARTIVDGRPRYWLADYKTNVIADGIDFDHDDLVAEMQRDDYVLQATLYQLALHRFLRWRLGPAHDPATDLLGSAYLFVRGMDPSRTPDDTRGVQWFTLPVPALLALDALVAGADGGAS